MGQDLINRYQNDPIYHKWINSFLSLKEYKDVHNQWPDSKTVLHNGFKLGKWITHQRYKYKKEELHDWQVELLNTIDFKWSTKKNWEDIYNKFKVWYYSNHRLPESNSKYRVEQQWYKWIITQRSNYKKNTLTNDQIDKLDRLNILYDYADKVWFENLIDLKSFIDKKKKLPSITSKNKKEKKLSTWLSSNRMLYKKDELSKDRRTAFEENNLMISGHDFKWLMMLKKANAFIKRHNRVPKKNGVEKNEDMLAQWRYHQNIVYNSNEMPKQKAELYKKSKLLTTDFISSWHKNLKEAIKFYKLMGYWPQAKVKDKEEAYLGDWIQKMRVYYKQNIYLDNTKRQLLVSSGVLDRTRNKSAWNENYERLEEFVKTHNRMPEYESTGDEKYLYNWYREKLYQTKTTLITDRQKELILKYEDQFVSRKKRREIKWRARYNQVKTFVEKNGRLPSRNLDNKMEKNLFEWLLYQKRKIKDGSLSKAQLRLMRNLNSIE